MAKISNLNYYLLKSLPFQLLCLLVKLPHIYGWIYKNIAVEILAYVTFS